MNVWTDIAIGNLLRVRPPPLDMDIETGELKPAELFKCCGPCGEWKPSDEFYVRHDSRWDKYSRQTTCKRCSCEKGRTQKNARATTSGSRDLILVAMTAPMSCRQICAAIGRTRRPVDLALSKMIRDGLVKRAGFGRLGTNSRIPLFVRVAE
jgi:hypothetical protein